MVWYWIRRSILRINVSLTNFWFAKGYMKKNKNQKKYQQSTNEKLVKMFEDQIPEDRMKVLKDIDSILCNMFNLELDDLPWINPNNHDQKWENLMNNLRLVVGRIEHASKQKTRTVH